MSDALPDRLCSSPDSKFYDEAILSKGIGVRLNGEERTNVEEYCISEGWARLAVGRTLDRRGRPMTIKVSGKIEVWIKGEGEKA